MARRIIGAKGTNMKRIVKQTEAKLRLRGVGSGYFEVTTSGARKIVDVDICDIDGYIYINMYVWSLVFLLLCDLN